MSDGDLIKENEILKLPKHQFLTHFAYMLDHNKKQIADMKK